MTQEKRIRIGLTLEGEMLQRFLIVKRKWGMESNVDIVRKLISDKYDEIREKTDSK